MAKNTPAATLDAFLAKIATATRLTVCTTEPSSFADIANVDLASVVMTAGLGGGDYSAALAGDVSGRKTTVAQQTDIAIHTTGDAQHVVLDDGAAIIAITTCTLQGLTSGGTVTVPAWDVEINAPT